MAIRTYDPKNVLCSFLGNLVTGFADGTFLSAERTEDGFAGVTGAGGETARVKSNNRMGTVTFTLMATAQSNDVLSALAALDELEGAGVGPLFVKEFNGSTVLSAQNAWIKKLPNVERGKEVSQVEWVIECEALEIFAGGLL
jgi:hypothetical protein